jgi:hypothetical protein
MTVLNLLSIPLVMNTPVSTHEVFSIDAIETKINKQMKQTICMKSKLIRIFKHIGNGQTTGYDEIIKQRTSQQMLPPSNLFKSLMTNKRVLTCPFMR